MHQEKKTRQAVET